LTNAEIRELELASRLQDSSILSNDLFAAYSECLEQRRYIVNRSIKLYRYIRYTVLDNDEFYAHVKLHIDDVVMIKEEGGESYAIIKAAFTHKYNDGNIYAFVWIDWLKDIERADALLNCPIFEDKEHLTQDGIAFI
jgi:hypothetical protein